MEDLRGEYMNAGRREDFGACITHSSVLLPWCTPDNYIQVRSTSNTFSVATEG